MHIMIAFSAGMMITIIGLVLTFAYLLTSGHLHAADPSRVMAYLIAPAIGALVALTGSALALRAWFKSRNLSHAAGAKDSRLPMTYRLLTAQSISRLRIYD